MRRHVTMADVAEIAQVSVSTVSHVVNGTRTVSEDLRVRVMDAIKESGFFPNTVARSLATSDTHLIGIVMPALTCPYFVPVVTALDRAGRRHGYSSVLADSGERVQDECDAVKILLSRRVDGMVIAPTFGDTEAVLDLLAAEGVPTVLIDRFGDDRFDQVGVENIDATTELVEHLAKIGHTKILFVGGMKGLSTSTERVEGYRVGLERSGLEFQEGLVLLGGPVATRARRAVDLLVRSKDRPTAIVSGTNQMTVDILRALRIHGLRVPEDIALVGYDDFDFADVLQPRMTVIAQPITAIADSAVKLLIRRITGKTSNSSRESIRIAPTFVHRDSCGCDLAAPARVARPLGSARAGSRSTHSRLSEGRVPAGL
jgi:LacI family transcriptional regulator